MKDVGLVQGGTAQAIPLVIGMDRVDVHTNITPITQDKEGKPLVGLFQYNEVQYDKDEYIKIMAEQNAAMETELTSTQLALCEIYESIGGVK